MPASLLASMMPWRQVLRSCADAPAARPADTANVAANRITCERLCCAICATPVVGFVIAEAHLTAPRAPAQGRTPGASPDRGRDARGLRRCGLCRFSSGGDWITLPYRAIVGRKHHGPESHPQRQWQRSYDRCRPGHAVALRAA